MSKQNNDQKKNIARSFAEIGQVMFNKFLDMDLDEKKAYLKEHGITWGAEYLGIYNKKTGTVRIETLKNPFDDNPVEGAIQGRPSFNDGARLVVRLKTGRIEGKPSTPNNIFGFEYIGKLSSKRYTDLTATAVATTLQDENKKLKSKTEAQKDRISILEATLADYKAKNQLLWEDVRGQHADNEHLKRMLEKERNNNSNAAEMLRAENNILKTRLDETKKLADIIIDRNITALLHVTQISNLENILSKGIVPTAMLGPDIARNDFTRFDRKQDCSSLSIGRVNSFYFRDIVRRSDSKQTFVCIYIKPSIILDENKKYYCHHNAATSSISYQTGRGELTTPDDFENMFSDTIRYTTIEGEKVQTRKHYHENDWPTSEQAEILYEGKIEPNMILAIGFPSSEILRKSMDLLKKYGIYGMVDKSVDF